MALTKDERRALELARERISGKAAKYICCALQDIANNDRAYVQAYLRLQGYISAQVGGQYQTLRTWQSSVGIRRKFNNDQIRADRLAWIDWMLGKPLPGEVMKLEWSSRTLCKDEAEYCGRTFVCYYADGKLFVDETTEGSNKYLGAFASVEQADAAIVAHVWPEA